ncbi:transmembrane protein 244 isoform X1 [Rana temporaria]|uniref:transmembrane protein 244 isoform X1 n=1 Tax=Rana temporaria TaxID=8407 RepID=UPI001AAC971C|nr:transmembrane protein 244 isoform X1 [Rana temporaria]
MALKIQVSDTKVVLQNLFICTAVFYTVYYFTYTICFVALRLENFDELGPFDFKTTPSWSNRKYLGNVISLETTFLISSAIFVFIVEEWIWDYACTVTVIHVGITSLVMKQLPRMTHWWISLGLGLMSMIFGGQILAYLLYKDNFIYPDLDDF